jgi:hypothetical protein
MEIDNKLAEKWSDERLDALHQVNMADTVEPELEKFSIPEGLSEEERKMMLDPLGYDAIKDIDEIYQRNRRKSDDPYIKATSKKMAHHFPKIDDAERR